LKERKKFQPITENKKREGDWKEYILNGTSNQTKISVDENGVSFSGNDEHDLKSIFKDW
jgi:hypothetical protein